MRYVTRVLQPGERVVYATKLHWLIYFRAILLLTICIILAAASWYLSDNQQLSLAVGIAAIIFALLALSSGLRAFIRRATTELAVTDQRVIAVYFDRSRKVQRLAEYGLKDGHVFDFVTQTTPTSGNDLNVVTSVLHNLQGKGTLGGSGQ